ncbi:MAG: hypothetical protein ACRD29_09730 [Acidimicrobiales bacterium]
MPPALSSMWRIVKLGYRNEPWLLVAAFLLSLLAALPDALLALWLKLLGEAVLDNDRPRLMVAAIGLGVSAAATWFLRTVDTRVQRRFRDKVTVALESHVAHLQASITTIAHQERPEYLDRLSVLRDQVFVLDHMYMSVFSTCGWILRLGVTIGLLVSIHPALAAFGVFALPTVLTSTWRPGIERTTEERVAPADRLAKHLFMTATTAPPGKEVRVTGIGGRLVDQRREAWERWYGPVAAFRWGSAAWHAVAWRRLVPHTPAPLCSWRRASTRRRVTCYSSWRPALGCPPTSGPPSARSASCAGSGSTAPDGWRGSRITPPRSPDRPTRPFRRGWRGASSSNTCRSRTRARTASCSTMCRWPCRRDRWWQSSGRTAPGRPRWSSCCASSTN